MNTPESQPVKPGEAIAPGHNPDRLTVAQVGGGRRLLDDDEIGYSNDISPRPISEIEARIKGVWESHSAYGADEGLTYRTRLSRAELRAARGLEPEATATEEDTAALKAAQELHKSLWFAEETSEEMDIANIANALHFFAESRRTLPSSATYPRSYVEGLEVENARLKAENAKAMPWKLFYGEGKSLGEIAGILGGVIYDYTPWIFKGMNQGESAEAKTLAAERDTLAARVAELEEDKARWKLAADKLEIALRSSESERGRRIEEIASTTAIELSKSAGQLLQKTQQLAEATARAESAEQAATEVASFRIIELETLLAAAKAREEALRAALHGIAYGHGGPYPWAIVEAMIDEARAALALPATEAKSEICSCDNMWICRNCMAKSEGGAK